MVWVRVVNGEVKEVLESNPKGKFHPSLNFEYTEENPKEGWIKDGNSFVEPQVNLPINDGPQWNKALSKIHEDLRLQNLTSPFFQVRLWAAANQSLRIAVLEFTMAFSQPLEERPNAVESAFWSIWDMLDSSQKADLNKPAIENWAQSNKLPINLPWAI